MAVLPDADRAAVSAAFQSDASASRDILAGVLRSDVRAAIDAVDSWVSSNATSFNNALPTAAKNNLTTAQKARLLMFVVRQRYLSGV